MLTRGPYLARRWYCLAETNRRPQTRPAQSGERGFLAGLRFASMISLQVSPSLVRFFEFAPSDHRRRHRFRWQEIGGEYRRRHVPATSE